MEPTVSVVIPTLERPELFRALESVRAQTLPCTQVLIVVDKSEVSRETQDFLKENETAIATGGGRGGAVARNVGLGHATGKYVAFLDDDDWWEPEKIKLQVEECRSTDAKVSWTATRFHSGTKTRILPLRPYTANEFVGDYLVKRPGLRHGDGYIQSSSLLVDRGLASQVRWDDALKKHQDWDFVIRLIGARDVRFAYLPSPLVNVQQASANSISVTRKWPASAQFLSKHDARFSRKAKADFILTQIARASLATGDLEGLRYAAKAHPRTWPNAGAVITAALGIAEFVRLQIALRRQRTENG